MWLRYVDDVFVLCKGNQQGFNEFVMYLNSRHKLIEFTATTSTHNIQYLDIEVYREKNRLYTKLYSKPTDKNIMLQRNSFHAPNTFKRIPKVEFMRARRICTK